MAQSDWVRVTRERPCPICEKPDNCSVSSDGGAVWCGREANGSIRQNDGGQWLHVLREREWPRRDDYRPKPSTSWPTSIKPESKPKEDWGRISKEAFGNLSAKAARHTLATRLGVSVESLCRLGVGWIPSQQCWTIPERDAAGNVIGINRRFDDGSKRRCAGSQAGLTFDPIGWLQSDNESRSVLLVEGGSDTAALLSHGVSAVGRPSNTGGVELLTELLRDVPPDRAIVVMAEHDRKSSDSLSAKVQEWHKPDCDGCSACWPGKFGAVTTAKKLAERLGRSIAWAFPPENAKDVRAWLNSRPTDERNERP